MITEGKFSSILHKNICCGYSLESPRRALESPRRGDSNEYPQHVFLWRNKQNYPITKSPPYIFYCMCMLFCGLTTKSTAMVMSRRSVNITTFFLGKLRPKRLTSTCCSAHPFASTVDLHVELCFFAITFLRLLRF